MRPVFSRQNINWGIKEFIKMYSNEPSYFSYKRFQTGMAFFIFTQGSIYVLRNHVHSVGDFIIWATPLLLIAGYTLKQTQKEKEIIREDDKEEIIREDNKEKNI